MDEAETRREPDLSRWSALSPLLDELLDLDAAGRAARLDALRQHDPGLAEDLAVLLARQAVLERESFLEQPVLSSALSSAPGAAGQRLGAYTLDHELGRGGMGSVWLARRSDGRYEAEVAIKLLQSGLFGAGDAGRFAREGQILARLDHPHIARLLDAGVADGGQPYLVLDYIAGEPIDHYVRRRGLDAAATVRLFQDVLAAVAHAHNRLILHRDLKPSNILVTAAGEVKLLDFGIAKLLDDAAEPAAATELTQRAGRAFTPQYAAPEQLTGGEVTTATDVYALGVLLYGLLGGGHPTPAAATGHTAPLTLMRAVVETAPRRLSDAVRRGGGDDAQRRARALRGDLDTIVARALKKLPAERYANAAALAEDLRRWLAHEPIAARPDSGLYIAAKFVRRHRLAVAAGSAAALALGLAIAGALSEGREAQRQREQAEGLIGFMLGELREKLQPVGRLDVLDAVGDKALAYYGAQDPARLDADALGRRARALHLIGEVAEQRGRLDDAARVFQQAADSTAELLAREPRNTQRLFEHAQSVFWLGNLARQRGQRDEAEQHLRRYLELTQALTKLEPHRVEWKLERAYAQDNLGILLLDAGRIDAAVRQLEPAREALAALLPLLPSVRGQLLTAMGWSADALERAGSLSDALKAHRERLALLDPSADPAQDVETQRLRADIHSKIGALELLLGARPQADASLQEAEAIYRRLLARDAGNLDLLGRLALVRAHQAMAAWMRDDAAAMRRNLDLAAEALPRLLAADGRKLRWQLTLRGQIALLRDRWARATAQAADTTELTAVLAAVQPLVDAGARLDGPQQRLCAELEIALGDRLQQQGRPAEARAQWSAAARRLDATNDEGHPLARIARAQALLRNGRGQEARILADNVEASGFRHPMYADLRRRLATAR